MRQASGLDRPMKCVNLFGPKRSRRRFNAPGSLQGTVDLMCLDLLHQPGPAFFREAVQGLSPFAVRCCGPRRQIARAGKT